MPSKPAMSCSHPSGYVDVEFGLLGVPSVGCAIGGLGKMPGIYFRQQNADSPHMCLVFSRDMNGTSLGLTMNPLQSTSFHFFVTSCA